MNYIFSEYIDSILSQHGHFLSQIGINNWALNKCEALLVIEQLQSKNIGVLGGDVYTFINNQFEITFDNWFFQRNDSISFVKESADFACLYIHNICSSTNISPLYFAIIPDFNKEAESTTPFIIL